jgi:hypothetical protein
MSESKLLRDIRLAIGSRPDCRIWRNNVARAVVGVVTWIKQTTTVTLNPGDVIVRNARILHAGLHEGSSDLILVRAILITPDMVGSTVGVLGGLEVKDIDGKVSPEQLAWDAMLRRFGARSGIVRSVEEAIAVVEGRSP